MILNEMTPKGVKILESDGYDPRKIVDQSFQTVSASDEYMNLRKKYNQLRINNQGRCSSVKLLHSCPPAYVKPNCLKDRMARKLAVEVEGQIAQPLLAQAVAEAAALAWSTNYPLLFLPALMEEKVQSARHWSKRQQEILDRQKALALAA